MSIAASRPLIEVLEGRVLNCIPSPNIEKDWLFEDMTKACVVGQDPIPDSKDLREDWWAIGDQADTGACIGWATGDSLLRWYFVKAGRLSTVDSLSARFIWMSAKETDEVVTPPTTFLEYSGASLKAALDVTRKYGAIPESALNGSTFYLGEMPVFYALASRFKIAGYANLERNVDAWRRWIAERGPILVCLGIDETWRQATTNGGRLDVYNRQTVHGGHAATVVGYTEQGFIIRNSWGVDWGDKGFAYASFAYAQEAFAEAYGIWID